VADLIKRVPFERPSSPQTGPLGKFPLSLLEVSDFYAAWHSQSQSFRTLDHYRLRNEYFTQPDFSWISEALGLNFDVLIAVGARQQLLTSFRTQDKKPDVNQLLYHHKQFALLFTKPADIVGVLQLLLTSFRTTLEGVKLDVRDYQWGQEISYVVPVINPVTATLFEGMKQYRDSRRR